jgi:hypothetical protein
MNVLFELQQFVNEQALFPLSVLSSIIINENKKYNCNYTTGCLKKNTKEIQQAVVHHKRG